jgi:myo-inositol-1-phosphate synthase
MVLYLPVGSQAAAEFYASAALAAGCSLVNCTPAVLGNSAAWRRRFAEAGLVLVGDDMKSHVGSTTIHQALLALLRERGVEVTSTYQLNVGGNTDFLNMRDSTRAAAKRATKATALGDLLAAGAELSVGPSDHVPQLRDHKVGYIHIEAAGYLGMPFSLELRLEVEDSPNAAPVAIDAIRLAGAQRAGIDLDLDTAMARLFKAPRSEGV